LAEAHSVDFTFNPYRFGAHEVDMRFSEADLSFLYDLKKRYPAFKATRGALDSTMEFVKQGVSGVCGMGKYMLAIDPCGNVGPCENKLDIRAGNILETDTKSLLKRLSEIHACNACNHCLTRERSEVEPLYQKIGSPQWFRECMAVKKG
jgi:MoaA/NifB/PqqE/SkfB family radical SAM enzyme